MELVVAGAKRRWSASKAGIIPDPIAPVIIRSFQGLIPNPQELWK